MRRFNYLLLLPARLLAGRPLKKVIYVSSSRGRNSKRSSGELLEQLLGHYAVTCNHSTSLKDKGTDESNSTVSLSREGARVLFGQEVDRKQKWSNAMLKRRADCGREGGTLKHSNVFHEYDPVYTPLFGCNEPFLLESPPGNSEKDRTLILYLPNKFCDDAEMDEEPKSPRRFPKAELDTMLREPRCGWGLLLILLRLRRRTSDLDKSVNEGTPTSSYWKKVWFPKTGLQFQRECTYKNQFGAMEVEEAVAQFRAWFAAAPLATYEYQTLPVKEIRSVLTRTFGESSYDGATEIIAGWSLRPSDAKAYCGSNSRVGMVKERAASHPSEGQRRNSDGTFTEEDYREATLDYDSLPTTPRQVVKHWQKYGILPQEAEGGRLEIRMTRKYGDKANGGLALCATRGPDKNRHYVYRSIRPQLLWQSKLPLVEVNRLLFDLSWDLANTQIAARRGWLKFSEKPKRVRHQPITRLRRVMQMVVAYSEEKRFETILLGGRGAEVEADASKLGRSRKSGVGRLGYNKAYVQFVGERGGDVFLDVFAHPEGGVERLSHVKEVLDGKLGTGSILHTDRARAYSAYVRDNPDLELYHCRVNHSAAEEEGFTWNLYMDAEDGPEFEETPDGYTMISVSTQTADGTMGNLKTWLRGKGGVVRKDIRRFVKEYQWRTNWSKKRDLYEYFLECFAEVEKDLREGRITVADLEKSVEWDFSSYSGTLEVDTYDGQNARQDKGARWVCPGCDKVIQGRHCAQYKFYHKKSCMYYAAPDDKTYDHESSRCLCCVFPRRGAKRRFSTYFAEEPGSAGERNYKKRGRVSAVSRKIP